MTRNSEERSPSLFVQALNEDAQAVFMGCPGREFILCCNLYLPKYNIPLYHRYQIQKKFISTFISLQGRIIFNMTMSVNDENSAGAANNNNCSKTADLDDHYVNSPGDLRSQMWPPCPPPPPPPSSAWLPDEPPTYTPLVKVRLFTYSVNKYIPK